MRTEQKWEELSSKYLGIFTPRLQADLARIKPPANLANFDDKNVFIFGEVDTGKTVLAAQMMMHEFKNIYLQEKQGCHGSTFFVSFPQMLYEIKQSFGPSEKSNDVFDKYLKAHLLVLDDFMTTRPTDWVLETIYHLINHRYEYQLRTIITSNKSLPELEAILQDQRITSRISRSYVLLEKKHY